MDKQQFPLFEKGNPLVKTEKVTDEKHQTFPVKGAAIAVDWKKIIRRLLLRLRNPLTALRYQSGITIRAYLKSLATRPFPWFQACLACLALLFFFKKDFHFRVNTNTSEVAQLPQSLHTGSPMNMSHPLSTATKVAALPVSINCTSQQVQAYIQRFHKVALVEKEKYGIPVAVKMGQAILASNAGTKPLAVQKNNHFNLYCPNGSGCQYPKEGAVHAVSESYATAWEGWRAHSLLLSQRYPQLTKLGQDYQQWAITLQNAGYSAQPDYARQLIAVINHYQLYQLDAATEQL